MIFGKYKDAVCRSKIDDKVLIVIHITQNLLSCIPSNSCHYINISTARTILNQLCPHSLYPHQVIFIMCHFKHFSYSILFHIRDTETHIKFADVLFISTKSTPFHVPLHSLRHIRFFFTAWTINPVNTLLISTQSPF